MRPSDRITARSSCPLSTTTSLCWTPAVGCQRLTWHAWRPAPPEIYIFCAQPDKFSFGRHVHIQGPESDIPWIIFKHVTRSTLRTTAQDVRACLKQCMHAVKACMELQSSLAHVVPRPLLWWYGNDTSPENREHIGIVNSSGNTHDNRPTHTDPAPAILTTTRPTTTITPFESGHHQR